MIARNGCGVPSDSCLIQDEPETGIGFSHKMSLKGRVGMLGIDHQHGRFRSDEPGTDPGVSGRQRGGAVCGAAPRGGVHMDGTNVGAASVRGSWYVCTMSCAIMAMITCASLGSFLSQVPYRASRKRASATEEIETTSNPSDSSL